MNHEPMKSNPNATGPDFTEAHRIAEVKPGVTAIRSVRLGLMQLGYALAARPPEDEGFLLLPGTSITRVRLEQEWKLAASVLRPDIAKRLSICTGDEGHFKGIPRDPDLAAQSFLTRALATQRPRPGVTASRGVASFVILKVLLHHWLMHGTPVTTDWLAETTGYSYPTIAGVLRGLGSLIERETDRRLRVRWFSREEFARLIAASDRARETARFADRSAHERTIDAHVRRLEKLAPAGLAIGGVLGARHYVADLDLVGAPRLDLSQHRAGRHLDLGFIEALDPALQRIEDPLEPATVVVHAVRHADPLFTPREGGLNWADPVECLLDLHESRLEPQAAQFLHAMQDIRPRVE